MNTNVMLITVLIVAIIATIQNVRQMLHCKRTVSLLKQENEAVVKEAFGGGWDACLNATRRYLSEPQTEMTRVSQD